MIDRVITAVASTISDSAFIGTDLCHPGVASRRFIYSRRMTKVAFLLWRQTDRGGLRPRHGRVSQQAWLGPSSTRLAYPAYAIVHPLVVVLFEGKISREGRNDGFRWAHLAFQPSEFAKLTFT